MTKIPSLGAPVPARQVDGWKEVYLSTKVEKIVNAFEGRISELEGASCEHQIYYVMRTKLIDAQNRIAELEQELQTVREDTLADIVNAQKERARRIIKGLG